MTAPPGLFVAGLSAEAITPEPGAIRLIRKDGVERLRTQPWAKGHIHPFDWRLTVGRTRWTAGARCNGGDSTWMRLVVAE